MKVLFYGESPTVETGLGQVSKHHIETFLELGWKIEAVCINHRVEDYDRCKYPFYIYKCPPDDSFNKNTMKDAILDVYYDVIFLSADCQHIAEFADNINYMRGQRAFKVVSYTPIDCDIIDAKTMQGLVSSDIAVTATYHAQSVLKRVIPQKKIDVIYHGCEPDVFFPIERQKREEYRKLLFNAEESTFVVVMVGRNQQRKDLARGMYAFHLFHEKYPNSCIYMHTKQNDVGGSLPFYAKLLGMKFNERDSMQNEIYFTAPDFQEDTGIERGAMNHVYNIADCYLSTSTGEGWGLCMTEAMSAGTPVLVPGNTSHLEIVGEQEKRGYFIRCGGHDLWVMPYGHTMNPRDICSVTSCVEQLEHIYLNREEAKIKAGYAMEWTKEHTWSDFRVQWKNILTQIQ